MVTHRSSEIRKLPGRSDRSDHTGVILTMNETGGKLIPCFLIGVCYLSRCCDQFHRDRQIPFSGDTPPPMMSHSVTTAESPRKKPLYEASTQFTNWRFSKEQLAQKRAALNVAAVEAVRGVIEHNAARQLAFWSASHP